MNVSNPLNQVEFDDHSISESILPSMISMTQTSRRWAMGILEPTDYSGEVTGTIPMMQKKAKPTNPLKHQNTTGKGDKTDPTTHTNPQDDYIDIDYDNLKKTNSGIILHPQPQDDPNDPLNWPIWRRDLALFVIGFHCFISGGQTPLLASAFTKLSKEFDLDLHTISYLVGAFMLAMGIGSLFLAPTAIIYGKRPIYLLALVIFLVGTLIASSTSSFGALLAARIITGFGASPTESLPSATIAEIFFAHERAYRLGLYTMLLLGGKNLIPLIAAFIIDGLDWNWLYRILAIIILMNLILTFFFVPETWFDRTPTPNKRSIKETELAREARTNRLNLEYLSSHPKYNSNASSEQNATTNARTLVESSEVARNLRTSSLPENIDSNEYYFEKEKNNRTDSATYQSFTQLSLPEHLTNATIGHNKDPELHQLQHHVPRPPLNNFASITGKIEVKVSQPPKKKTYTQLLSLYDGRQSQDKWWMIALRPIVLCLYPSILFSTIVYSFAVVWLMVMGETISKVFANDPYNFSPTTVGLLYVSAFTGSCFGSAAAGYCSDIVVRYMSRRNNGVYEPEFRLVMMLPIFITITMGLMGYGWASQNEDAWIVPTIFLGIIGFGCSLASTTSITYAVDSYRIYAGEALVTLNLVKNVLGFIFSLFTSQFVDCSGTKITFVAYGSIQIAICLITIPMYIYGKRFRYWSDNANLMKYLYVRDGEEAESEPKQH
ncbi:MFS general substrate transporter [Nadsonia fulvescens var. elongata DSM 6958]|uniref:MFS general substrate transporter n=1 Tax=Nadsonia fulvescens var. elongata DSM 6958 TaxID=857566 RepID=A0A1E3PMT6_9ASCO|nr:MFS general substrate transporter [Nadsonia fulvescens var. elongata DSM 6958]